MLFLLTLLAAPALQEPTPALPPDPARVAWNALQKRFNDAQGIRIQLSAVLEDPAADDTEAATFTMKIDAALAQPGAGRILIDGASAGPDGDEPLKIRFLGTAKGVYRLDDSDRTAVSDGTSWSACSAMFFLPFLGKGWAGEEVPADTVVFLPAREDHTDWIGLALTGADIFGEEATASAWLDAQGALQSFRLPLGGTAMLIYSFEKLELLKQVDVKEFLTVLPEGFEVIETSEQEAPDFEAGLLSVGATAPEVSFTAMDDAQVALASLKGKTVLLNFWFYH